MSEGSKDTGPAAALRDHGGAINAARALYPDAAQPWIDLSTGVNPLPYPLGELPISAWTGLPDAGDLAELEELARVAYRASPATEAVAGPGTQALIQWLPRLGLPRLGLPRLGLPRLGLPRLGLPRLAPAPRVGILAPTYGGHERSWRAAGARIVTATCLEEALDCDAAVVVNPNNPDGRLIAPERLTRAAAELSARGGLLIVDEAFMETAPTDASLAPRLAGEGAIVLRSFGKIYGLAGIRLGFALAAPALAARLREALGPWPASGPAIAIGKRALADVDWLAASRVRLRRDAARLDAMLRAAGFEILGGTSLFRLVRRPDAGLWFTRLCRAGVLTRPFETHPDRLRFGLPYEPEHWARLAAVLSAESR